MAAVRDFEELTIFQKARELSKKIYPVTNREVFKSDYRFVQQIRAAAGSICGEVRSQLIRANDVGYLTSEEFDELYSECRKLSAGIMNFIKEIKASDITGAKYKT